MRRWLPLVLVLLIGRGAAAQPLRVTIECEEEGRTKACPAFLLGFVDAHPVLLQSPRATADVIVYANASEVALVDRVHLRFVGTVPGAPPVIEIDVDLDTRADDDTQRAQLEPAFLRGIALFVGARFPNLVKIELGAVEAAEAVAKNTTPWDVGLDVGGWGNWTNRYRSYNGSSSVWVARIERRSRAQVSVSGNGGVNKQPPLVVDGQEIASGKVRKDKVLLGLSLGVGGQVMHPTRRHHVSVSPSIEWQLGAHIDLNLAFSVTKRELPGPDESLIDPTDYALQSRLSYAELLAINGSFNLTLHADRTNGERNDRFTDL